jgi:hypothetical protein
MYPQAHVLQWAEVTNDRVMMHFVLVMIDLKAKE